ncbi:MAG: cyclic nucleotide-binding domain-containing protein [SAR324 cluster bacterium]|nr:cyclic nucleotide-binding domain-containing protein [SAR324 cluster bacterium]
MIVNANYPIVEYKQGDIVFEEGDTEGHFAYLILEGSMDVYRIIDGKKIILNTLPPREIFGEMAVITAEPRSASVVAAEDSKLVRIDERLLMKMLGDSDMIVKAITQQLIQRFKMKDKQVTAQLSGNPFMSFSHLTHLLYYKHRGVLGYGDLCVTVKDILAVSHLELNNMLKWIQQASLLQIETVDGKKMIKIPNHKEFMANIQLLEQEKPYKTMKQEEQYLDIFTLAKELKCKPQQIVTQIQAGRFPVDTLFFPKAKTLEWYVRHQSQNEVQSNQAESASTVKK